jgi:hypothetical protein
MNVFQIAKLVVGLLPVVIEAIKMIEAAIPGNGKGEQKLAFVRSTLESTMGVAGHASQEIEKVWQAICPLITLLVPVVTKK